MKYFLIKVCTFVFRHNAIAHFNGVQYSVNITFMCAGKPESECDLLYRCTLLQGCGTKPAVSLRSACIVLQCTLCKDFIRGECPCKKMRRELEKTQSHHTVHASLTPSEREERRVG